MEVKATEETEILISNLFYFTLYTLSLYGLCFAHAACTTVLQCRYLK